MTSIRISQREIDAVEAVLSEALENTAKPSGFYRPLSEAVLEAAKEAEQQPQAVGSDIVGQAILGEAFEPINPRRKQEAYDRALGEGRN